MSLRPLAEFTLRGDELEWLDSKQTEPTQAEIDAEVARLQEAHEAEAAQKAADKASANAKLKALGLTDAEIEDLSKKVIEKVANVTGGFLRT